MHRIVTHDQHGETRIIEYQSRAAALSHFGKIANSRQMVAAELEKYTGAAWEGVASMQLGAH